MGTEKDSWPGEGGGEEILYIRSSLDSTDPPTITLHGSKFYYMLSELNIPRAKRWPSAPSDSLNLSCNSSDFFNAIVSSEGNSKQTYADWLLAVCKYLAVELQGRLEETGKMKEYIVTGHGIMPGDIKRKDYYRS